MEATFKVGNGRLMFKVSGEKAKDLWSQLAQIDELFCAETKCGLCQCQDLRYGHRVAMKGNKPCHYYELVCRSCGAQFGFGQRQDTGELFPKRKNLETKQPLPNGGWRKWEDRGADPDEGEYDQRPASLLPPAGQQEARTPPPAGQAQSARDLTYEQDAPPPSRRERRSQEQW